MTTRVRVGNHSWSGLPFSPLRSSVYPPHPSPSHQHTVEFRIYLRNIPSIAGFVGNSLDYIFAPYCSLFGHRMKWVGQKIGNTTVSMGEHLWVIRDLSLDLNTCAMVNNGHQSIIESIGIYRHKHYSYYYHHYFHIITITSVKLWLWLLFFLWYK